MLKAVPESALTDARTRNDSKETCSLHVATMAAMSFSNKIRFNLLWASLHVLYSTLASSKEPTRALLLRGIPSKFFFGHLRCSRLKASADIHFFTLGEETPDAAQQSPRAFSYISPEHVEKDLEGIGCTCKSKSSSA